MNTLVGDPLTLTAMSTLESPLGNAGLQAAATWLDENFTRLVEEHGVPGASIAVLANGETAAAAGVTSLATRVQVDPDTVFQIGSITKIWTATLVMQLAPSSSMIR